jgi:zinc transporter, ZIP family
LGEAALWGAVAASSLSIGAELALRFDFGRRQIGLIMAFGVGALISAVAYELVQEALNVASGATVTLGLLAGAIAFFVGDRLIERAGGGDRKSAEPSEGEPLAIVLGSVLDGIPESIVLGMSLFLGEGVSVGLLAGIFLSNLPEALASTAGLTGQGWSHGRVRRMWLLIVVVSTLSAALGYLMLSKRPDTTGAFVQSFAGGALLTMLADTMVPEAFEQSGPLSGLVTTLGFIVALALSTLA